MDVRATSGSSGATVAPAPRFYSVADAAKVIGTSPVTLYRAIRDGEFPAVRIRGRLIIPARVLDEMVSAAVAGYSAVDAAQWVAPTLPAPRSPREV